MDDELKLYDTDPAAWADQQADALRRRAASEVDWDNVAEEIEHLSRSDRREIRSRLEVICTHLLKLAHQPLMWSSWRGSVREARRQIADLVEESPSLGAYPATVLARAYRRGRETAMDETGLTDLPAACPWTIEQVLDGAFWP
jgi:hypothetical protein